MRGAPGARGLPGSAALHAYDPTTGPPAERAGGVERRCFATHDPWTARDHVTRVVGPDIGFGPARGTFRLAYRRLTARGLVVDDLSFERRRHGRRAGRRRAG
jgi:hypothetical protein